MRTWLPLLALLSLACSNTPPQSHDEDAGSSADAATDAGVLDGGSWGEDQCVLAPNSCDAGQSCLVTALTDGGLGTRCVEGACDLVTQDCGLGQKCTYVGNDGGYHRDCVADGTADDGQPCTGTPSSNTCKAGLICALQEAADGGSESRCAKFCNATADCTTPAECYVLVAVGGTDERPLVCGSPPQACDLFGQDCAKATDGCYPSGTTAACFALGAVADGAPCQFANDCLKGSACSGSAGSFVCRPLCGTGGTPACASGICSALTGLAGAGVCR